MMSALFIGILPNLRLYLSDAIVMVVHCKQKKVPGQKEHLCVTVPSSIVKLPRRLVPL